MRKTKNKFITIPRLIIMALLLLTMTIVLWIFLRGALIKGLIGGIINLEDQGYEVTHGGLIVEGFPFSVSAASRDISIRAPRTLALGHDNNWNKNWSVKTENLQIRSATLTPLSWNITHKGQIRIDMHGHDGERYWFKVVPANIEAGVVISMRGELKSARFDMSHAQLDSLIGTPPVISKIEYLDGDIKIANDIGQISLHAEDLRLSPKIPGMLDNVLGRKLALVEINANIDNWQSLGTDGTNAWIAANGHISAEHWIVLWGKADMVGSFDINFKNGKPEGKIQIRIKKPTPLIDKIAETSLIPEKYASTINTLIALRETEDDGRKAINLTIKDGVVKMGFITLFEF